MRCLLRGGRAVVKAALEFNIIVPPQLSDQVANFMAFCEAGPMKGTVLGSVQIVLSNVGRATTRESALVQRNEYSPEIKFNDVLKNHSRSSMRPSLIIRAKNFQDNQSARVTIDLNPKSDNNVPSERIGGNTLSHDELSLLFKKFQGDTKGTVQYIGPLMKLLQVHSICKPLSYIHKYFIRVGENEFRDVRFSYTSLFMKRTLNFL